MLIFYPQNTLFFEQIGLILTIINSVIINIINIDIIIIILFYYNNYYLHYKSYFR